MTDLADDAGPGDPRAGERLLRRATYLAVGVALLLAAVKAVAWFLTGSVSLLSSFIDSLLDAVASAVNLIAVREALRPATAAYRFGRGKLEPMAGLFQAAFISGSALLLFSEAIERLVEPEPIRAGGFGIAVMLFSIVATVALVWFQRHVVRRTKSLAISADSLHYTGDLLANSAVIIAILLTTQLGWHMADPIFGLGIAGYILYNAWRIAVRAFQMLLDRELDEADRDKIRAIAMSHPEVMALHDLRTR
ncbi:MAG: cation diffusion facilitator family transporter, partial [Alphaproteobacteria bacterium]